MRDRALAKIVRRRIFRDINGGVQGGTTTHRLQLVMAHAVVSYTIQVLSEQPQALLEKMFNAQRLSDCSDREIAVEAIERANRWRKYQVRDNLRRRRGHRKALRQRVVEEFFGPPLTDGQMAAANRLLDMAVANNETEAVAFLNRALNIFDRIRLFTKEDDHVES